MGSRMDSCKSSHHISPKTKAVASTWHLSFEHTLKKQLLPQHSPVAPAGVPNCAPLPLPSSPTHLRTQSWIQILLPGDAVPPLAAAMHRCCCGRSAVGAACRSCP